MAKKKDEYLVIPVEEKEMEEKNSPTDVPNQAEDELEEKFDKVFWLKVWAFMNINIEIVYLNIVGWNIFDFLFAAALIRW